MQPISISRIRRNSFSLKWLILLFLMLILGLTATYLLGSYYNDNYNRKNNTENNGNSGNSSNSSNSSKPEIKIQEDQKHQLGKHFNKHGRGMGYGSKSEYNRAAIEFAKSNRTNPNSKIFEGIWRTRGDVTRDLRQIIITHENRTVILDKLTGQVIDFYKGAELRGLINIIPF